MSQIVLLSSVKLDISDWTKVFTPESMFYTKPVFCLLLSCSVFAVPEPKPKMYLIETKVCFYCDLTLYWLGNYNLNNQFYFLNNRGTDTRQN